MYRHRHHSRFAHPRRGFPGIGILWIFGLAFLFLHGWWWPGILILVGLSMLFGSIAREFTQQPPADIPPMQPPQAAPVPAPVPPAPAPFLPTAAATGHRVDLLPSSCPRCGGPIRAHEVKWAGMQAAACPYCGTNLPMSGMKK